MQLLAQFLLRLAFGLAVGMGITSSRQVSSDYFRTHLYVTLGLATLAALALAKLDGLATWLAGAGAAASFLGAAFWLYESPRAGKIAVWLVAACAFASAVSAASGMTVTPANFGWRALATASSGLALGLVLAAMLLGHWYVNDAAAPLGPLRRLMAAAAVAVIVRAALSALGTVNVWSTQSQVSTVWWLFLVLRWSFGICGVLALLWMAWKTLEIPNTQSATGILYVAVIGVFVGELAAALLSAQSVVPL